LSSSPVHFYIYYRIATPHGKEARAALTGVMEALAKEFAVSGRFLRSRDDPDLWMEVYENVREPLRFEAQLSSLLAQTPFAAWLTPGSARRTERFVTAEP